MGPSIGSSTRGATKVGVAGAITGVVVVCSGTAGVAAAGAGEAAGVGAGVAAEVSTGVGAGVGAGAGAGVGASGGGTVSTTGGADAVRMGVDGRTTRMGDHSVGLRGSRNDGGRDEAAHVEGARPFMDAPGETGVPMSIWSGALATATTTGVGVVGVGACAGELGCQTGLLQPP
jgi:hypothetical protein